MDDILFLHMIQTHTIAPQLRSVKKEKFEIERERAKKKSNLVIMTWSSQET